MALEFLQSVGTFRPKREILAENGALREKVDQLGEQLREQKDVTLKTTERANAKQALSRVMQQRKFEHLRIRETVRGDVSRRLCFVAFSNICVTFVVVVSV